MIKIEQLAPLIKCGFVAMDKDGSWWWFEKEPIPSEEISQWLLFYGDVEKLTLFNIEPAKDWTKSLMRCGNE